MNKLRELGWFAGFGTGTSLMLVIAHPNDAFAWTLFALNAGMDIMSLCAGRR
jgi:hypothetical protein